MCQSVHTNKAICPPKCASLSTQTRQSVHLNVPVCPHKQGNLSTCLLQTFSSLIKNKTKKKWTGMVPENSFTSRHENNEHSPAKRWWQPHRQFVWQGSQVWAQQRSQAPFSSLPSGKHLPKTEWYIYLYISRSVFKLQAVDSHSLCCSHSCSLI